MVSVKQRNRGYTSDAPERREPAWVLLAYRLPRDPSTPRIAVWRKLRQLGAVQLVDSLVALPADNRTREQFAWLAGQIREAAGDAWTWEGTLTSKAQARELADRLVADITAEYESLADQARAAERQGGAFQSRALLRLRRELHRVEARDYFAAPGRERARLALDSLAARLEEAAS